MTSFISEVVSERPRISIFHQSLLFINLYCSSMNYISLLKMFQFFLQLEAFGFTMETWAYGAVFKFVKYKNITDFSKLILAG